MNDGRQDSDSGLSSTKGFYHARGYNSSQGSKEGNVSHNSSQNKHTVESILWLQDTDQLQACSNELAGVGSQFESYDHIDYTSVDDFAVEGFLG
jgi:hypothetical protein